MMWGGLGSESEGGGGAGGSGKLGPTGRVVSAETRDRCRLWNDRELSFHGRFGLMLEDSRAMAAVFPCGDGVTGNFPDTEGPTRNVGRTGNPGHKPAPRLLAPPRRGSASEARLPTPTPTGGKLIAGEVVSSLAIFFHREVLRGPLGSSRPTHTDALQETEARLRESGGLSLHTHHTLSCDMRGKGL